MALVQSINEVLQLVYGGLLSCSLPTPLGTRGAVENPISVELHLHLGNKSDCLQVFEDCTSGWASPHVKELLESLRSKYVYVRYWSTRGGMTYSANHVEPRCIWIS